MAASSDAEAGATERTRKRNDLAGKIYKVVKCGVVGDGTVGKSCLLMTYTMAGFDEHYVPTIFDNFSVLEDFEGKLVNITLWDTAGQDDYLAFRTSTCYRQTDIFLVCFSTVNPHSFQNVKQKWVPELQTHAPNTPIILCGTQTDLRADEAAVASLGVEPISTKAGQKRAKEIKALTYVECSAKDLASVTNVFRTTITFLLDKDAKQRAKVQKQYKKELALEKKYLQQQAKLAKKAGGAAADAADAASASSSSDLAASSPSPSS